MMRILTFDLKIIYLLLLFAAIKGQQSVDV